MIAGRDFTEAELTPGPSEPVAIVDDLLAQQLWPGESALGRLIQFGDAEGAEAGRAMRVVGIMPAVKHSLSNPRLFPHVYVPLGQRYESAMTLQLRVADTASASEVMVTIRRVIAQIDQRLPVLRVQTWRDHVLAGLDALAVTARDDEERDDHAQRCDRKQDEDHESRGDLQCHVEQRQREQHRGRQCQQDGEPTEEPVPGRA